MKKLDKRAQTLGTFNLVIGIILLFVVIVTIAVTGIMLVSNLNDTGVGKLQESNNFVNQTTTAMNATGWQLTGTSALGDCRATVTVAANATDGVDINTGNYSVSGCLINASTAAAPFLNVGWNVSGTYTYTINKITPVAQNYSLAQTNYFKNVPTLFTILFIVSLIALFVIILFMINRFSGGGQTRGL